MCAPSFDDHENLRDVDLEFAHRTWVNFLDLNQMYLVMVVPSEAEPSAVAGLGTVFDGWAVMRDDSFNETENR